jgi:hypothetical protein
MSRHCTNSRLKSLDFTGFPQGSEFDLNQSLVQKKGENFQFLRLISAQKKSRDMTGPDELILDNLGAGFYDKSTFLVLGQHLKRILKSQGLSRCSVNLEIEF